MLRAGLSINLQHIQSLKSVLEPNVLIQSYWSKENAALTLIHVKNTGCSKLSQQTVASCISKWDQRTVWGTQVHTRKDYRCLQAGFSWTLNTKVAVKNAYSVAAYKLQTNKI